MTTIETHAPGAEPIGTGLACITDWVTTTDHKKIGRLYIGTSVLAALATLVVVGLLALERIDISRELLDGGSLTQLFTLQRFGLLYLVLAPAVVGIAVAVVPMQIGARSIAFPRLAAAGYWAWLFGVGLGVYATVMNGGPNGGEGRFYDLFVLSTILALAGLLASMGSVAVSVLTTRAPGMNMRRLPYLAWASLVGGLGMLVALPVLMGVLLYLYVGHHYNPTGTEFGGNQEFATWAGFGFTQPLTLLFLLPVLGAGADIVATATGRRLAPRGGLYLALGLAGLAFVAGATQGTASIADGFSALGWTDKLSQLLPYGIAYGLPALGVFLATALVLQQLRNKPRMLGGVLLAVPALLVGVLGAAASVLGGVGGTKLPGTTFEEGTLFALTAAGLLGGLATLVHWAPKFTGRTVPTKPLLPIALLGLAGGALGALGPMIAGFAEQPSGIFPAVEGGSDSIVNFTAVDGPSELWNSIALAGAAALLLAVLAAVAVLLRACAKGDVAGDDPYGGLTLEWATTSPAPVDNFADVHIVRSAEPLLDLKISNGSDA